MNKFMDFVVVLAPAIACALVGFVVEAGPPILKFVDRKIYSSVERAQWAKEVVSHGSFYGTAFLGLLGLSHDAPGFYFFAVIWFLVFQSICSTLVDRIQILQEEESRVRFRKTAGMVRSIVKDELNKSASKIGCQSDS